MPDGESPIDHTHLDSALRGLAESARWYVGFSGGLDSTVLLHLLSRWSRAHPGTRQLTAIHINHGLQAEAGEWQVHCEWICKFLNIPLISRQVAIKSDGAGIEAAARDARYQVFEQILEGGDVLFLGHHLDDQVETFFLRLMRGAGVHGLAGIPARRQLGRGILARPLLQTTRAQLETYAESHGLDHVEDPSNTDAAMDRNFIRVEILPLLASRWPAYRQAVSRASAHMAGAMSAMETALPALPEVYSRFGDPGVAQGVLLAGSDEAAAAGLRRWLRQAGCQMPDRAQLEEFLRQLRASDPGKSPRMVCANYSLQRYRDVIYRLAGDAVAVSIEPFPLLPGDMYEVPGVGKVGLVETEDEGLLFASDTPLKLAWRSGGERCRPHGRSGSNSLKKLLQEAAVPPWWRDRVPLLYREDELLAVGGLWLCDSTYRRASATPDQLLWKLSWEPALGPPGH